MLKINSIVSGMVSSIIVFVGGYYLSELIWIKVDGRYAHGPGLSTLFMTLLFIFCFVWLIVGISKRKDRNRGLFWLGSAITNFCFIIGTVGSLFFEFNKDSERENDAPSESITNHRDTLNRGGVVVKQNGDTLLEVKNDSLRNDKTKQANYLVPETKDSIK